jgi:acyl-CoA thioester hydrolase
MEKAPTRADYRWFLSIPTRWMDNDVYGHVNNVVYYSYFDTVVNKMLIAEGLLDIERSPTIGLCVESHCAFAAPLVFPETVEAGLRIGRLGNSSVRYEIALFRSGVEAPAATGHFVHVFVDRATRRPAPLDENARAILERLMIG